MDRRTSSRVLVFALGALASFGCSASEVAREVEKAPPPSGPSPSGDEETPREESPPDGTGCAQRAAAFATVKAAFAKQLAQKNIPGGSIAVLCEGSRIFSAGVGSTARSGGAPVKETTRFQIASITKMLTAIVAMRLSERGSVDLGGSVAPAVPFVNTKAPYARDFTWSELLSHTSGYPTSLGSGELDLESRYRQVGSTKLWAPPGAVFNYSNEGYAIAGLALQRKAGKPFAALVKEHVFDPAGMTGASMDAAAVQKAGDYAKGHAEGTEVVEPTDGYLASTYYGPMGGAWASARDMASLARALLKDDGTLLRKETRDAMTKPHTKTTWGARQYGLGVIVDQLEGGDVVWSHDGSVGGYLGSFVLYPKQRLALAVLVNSDADFPSMEDVTYEAFTGKKIPAPAAPLETVDEAECAGSYTSLSLGNVTIAASGGGLTFNGKRMTKLYGSTYEFDAADGYPDTATFWRADGKVKYLVAGTGVASKN
ncbi:MAG: beta-lactamase family protein [Deltaproteobacteria bacterium]|nr:beta-lactamase family protein [Deltaproteobacteria bacterium]